MPLPPPVLRRIAPGLAGVALLAGIVWTCAQVWRTADLVPIPDAPLEAAIRRAAEVPEGPLTHESLREITEINCAQPVDLAGLQYCESLERLSLGVPHPQRDADELLARQFEGWQFLESSPRPASEADLSMLTHLPRLIRLSLWGYDLNDLSPVAQFPNLSYLSVTGAPVESFTPLRKMSLLQGLYVQTTKVPDVMPLTELTDLRELGIASIGGQGSIPYSTELWLPRLTGLQRLELAHVGLGECQAVRQLPHLQVVNFEGNVISDATPFATLRSIRSVNLRDNRITDVVPLAAMVQRNRLRAKEITIDLRGNPLKESSIAHLRNMRSLGAKVLTNKDETYEWERERKWDAQWTGSYFGSQAPLMHW